MLEQKYTLDFYIAARNMSTVRATHRDAGNSKRAHREGHFAVSVASLRPLLTSLELREVKTHEQKL